MKTPALDGLRAFIDASPTPYQAVEALATRLVAAGGQLLDETAEWHLEPGRVYFAIRGGSSLLAFRLGLRPAAEEGFALAGAHTDSPALKLRLEKNLASRGMNRCAVEIYGGPIVSTWLDRPLALAGRVVVSTPKGPRSRLIHIERAVGLVPNLAIHLNREVNKGYEYNAQTQLPLLLSSSPLARGGPAPSSTTPDPAVASPILELVADELGLKASEILAGDLFFVDAQKIGFIGEDLVNGYRLDNLLGCHSILEALLAAKPGAQGQVAAFFDGEEIGSGLRTGADSSFLRDLLGRLCALQGASTEGFYRALASSFQVSVDVAQAWHPGWPEKFDETYAPLLNGGPAIKANANFRYATDAEGEARFRAYCAAAELPCQKFMTRADMTPGSTIGPVSAALTGIATVDVGAPLLSMHSLRETAGTRDHEMMIAALTRHFDASPKLL